MNDIAAKLVDDLKRFERHAKDKKWTSERDCRGAMSIEVFDLFAGESDVFEVVSERAEGRATVYDMNWRGEGTTLADVERDFFCAYGRIAEETQFIRIEVRPETVIFSIVSGYAGRVAHGHFTQIRLVGERIARVAQGYNEIKSQIEKKIGKVD